MRLFRGISVEPGMEQVTIDRIYAEGIVEPSPKAHPRRRLSRPLADLLVDPQLSQDMTRGEGDADHVTFACGDPEGATFYAQRRTGYAPVIIEFDVDPSKVTVDGNDFLYTVFTRYKVAGVREALLAAFGPTIEQYFDAASGCDAQKAFAICDLAVRDHNVVESHFANQKVIGGRYETQFRSAFMVAVPILPEQIIQVSCAKSNARHLSVDIHLSKLLQ